MRRAKLDTLRNPSQFVVLSYLSKENNNAYGLSRNEDMNKSARRTTKG